jgi:hypothetical protein
MGERDVLCCFGVCGEVEPGRNAREQAAEGFEVGGFGAAGGRARVSFDGHGGAETVVGEGFEDGIGDAMEVQEPGGSPGGCGGLRERGKARYEGEGQGGSEEIAAFHWAPSY